MMSENVTIGLEEEEPPAVRERAMHWSDRRHGGVHQCFVPKRVCLQNKENCGKGEAQ